MVGVLIDAFTSSPTVAQTSETEEWRLPTYDPRNENKYLYRLHSLDVYLWTEADAKLFINTVRRLVPAHHLAISGEQPAPAAHADAMSPIVQQLENVAITQQQGRSQYAQSHHSGSKPGSTVQQTTLPGPPGVPPPQISSPQTIAAISPAPYNPAAPAAPETIAHREKTPPPPEDGQPNPLMAAATHDQPQYQQQYQQYQQQQPAQQAFSPQPLGRTQTAPVTNPGASYFQGPPQAGSGQYAPQAAPPITRTPVASPPPPAASPYAPGYPANYAQQQSTSPLGQNPYPSSPGFAQPPQQHHPTMQGYAHPVAPTAPTGGFSNFNYGQAQQQGGEYQVHNQMYRPTEAEASVKANKLQEGGAGQGGFAGKIGGNAVRLEKGVTGFLRKFEKKYA